MGDLPARTYYEENKGGKERGGAPDTSPFDPKLMKTGPDGMPVRMTQSEAAAKLAGITALKSVPPAQQEAAVAEAADIMAKADAGDPEAQAASQRIQDATGSMIEDTAPNADNRVGPLPRPPPAVAALTDTSSILRPQPRGQTNDFSMVPHMGRPDDIAIHGNMPDYESNAFDDLYKAVYDSGRSYHKGRDGKPVSREDVDLAPIVQFMDDSDGGHLAQTVRRPPTWDERNMRLAEVGRMIAERRTKFGDDAQKERYRQVQQKIAGDKSAKELEIAIGGLVEKKRQTELLLQRETNDARRLVLEKQSKDLADRVGESRIELDKARAKEAGQKGDAAGAKADSKGDAKADMFATKAWGDRHTKKSEAADVLEAARLGISYGDYHAEIARIYKGWRDLELTKEATPDKPRRSEAELISAAILAVKKRAKRVMRDDGETPVGSGGAEVDVSGGS